MCGIAGFVGFRNDKLIKQISNELLHRGPDGEGYYIDDNVTLLNRRLAIIDRKGGDQPIVNEDKSMVVVYNGEIYNFQELREKLESYGHQFKTKSDTEVIVHGYEQWGDSCFDKFNGMFAIALYDIKNKVLILARDHFGIKPLYYVLLSMPGKKRGIIFSSELKPLINSGLVKKQPNDKVIYRYLRYRLHDDQKETFFSNIFKLMPGETMAFRNSGFEIKQYSSLRPTLTKNATAGKFSSADIEKFKMKLQQAVRMRLISEVPVGTCLSGGLDSSAVVSIVNKLLKEKVSEASSVGKKQNTFSAVFPGGTNDEEKYIDLVLDTQELKISSHKIIPKPEKFFEELCDFVRTQEEPTISTGPYAQYKVMEEAHKCVTVLLDGQGSDEMMAGYLPYYFTYLKQLKKQGKYRDLLLEALNSKDVILNYLKNKLKVLLGLMQPVEMEKMLDEKFLAEYKNEKFNPVDDNLKLRLIEDIFHNSLPSLLRYEDKNSMHFSIEGRVPFLDFNLLKYLFSLSDEAVIKNGWNKYILRQSLESLLPEQILKRRNKIGFTTPEYQWFMRMKNKIYSVFLSQSFAKRKYFNQAEVLKFFQKFIEGKNDDTMVFWRFLNVELWMREFFDSKKVIELTSSRVNGLKANEGKKLQIEVNGKTYLRYPIKTELFEKGDEYAEKITKEIAKWLNGYIPRNNITIQQNNNQKWFVIISEKIVAISQGRSYFIWDIRPTFMATLLSNYVTRTPAGIGLGSPWTMQIAINEVGLPRILLATVISVLGKLAGIKGLFYMLAGESVRSIDGPTEYSLYPSNVSAKLGPKDPQKAATKIHKAIDKWLNGYIANNKNNSAMKQFSNFLGVAIIDANDIGRNVLGNTTDLSNKQIEEIMRDNPMGQASEQTPVIICVTG